MWDVGEIYPYFYFFFWMLLGFIKSNQKGSFKNKIANSANVYEELFPSNSS